MEMINFVIGMAALIIAILAFQRTGGMQDLPKQMEDLSAKLESFIRGQDKSALSEKNKPPAVLHPLRRINR
ncbi:MAG: hypothetical protein AB7P17_13770 [Nitrospirales bacterium]|nr:hypothetical protein [Nitrospirales bacterium]